jgi:putative transcriptional regulator
MELFPLQEPKQIKKGDLLISEPLLPDSNFARSVILICDDTNQEHIGFVINKIYPNYRLNHLVTMFEQIDKEVRLGGPVQQNVIQVLHKNPSISETCDVSDGIYWGGDFDEIRNKILTNEMSIDDTWFFLGYSGWYKNQLKKELEENSWLVLRHDLSEIMSFHPEEIWKKCVLLLEKKFHFMTKFPTDPRLN